MVLNKVRVAMADNRFTILSRGWILILDILAVSFLANALVLQQYFETGLGSFADGLTLAPVGWSLLWTSVAFGLNLSGVRHPPGLDVAMELIGWTLTAGTVWALLWSVAMYPGWGAVNCTYYYSTDQGNRCTHRNANLLIASESIAVAAVLVMGLLHFILFVKACRATQRKNRTDQEERQRVLGLEERVQELEARLKMAEL